MALSALKHLQIIQCPDCSATTVAQIWSCGCKLTPALMHCKGKSFREHQKLCGQLGSPSTHTVEESEGEIIPTII